MHHHDQVVPASGFLQNRFLPLRIRDVLAMEGSGQEIKACGWIRTVRVMKDIVFLEINDGSSPLNLQAVLDGSRGGLSGGCHTGASVEITGTLHKSPAREQAIEIHVDSLQVLGDADPETYPLQKKRHSFEFLRDIAHLRPRTATFGSIARLRNAMASAVHEYFQHHGYQWVHTPIITASDCEGAGQMFQVTTLDMDKVPRTDQGSVDYSRDFFGKKAHLTVSGQLNGETHACALGRIYTFGPTFRAENSNTARHLSEFWMIEPETAFLDINGNMDLAENFVRFVLARTLESIPDDMDFFDQRIQPGLVDTLVHVINSPFRRITYTEAVEALQKSGKTFEYPPVWGIDLQSEHERCLTEEIHGCPVIVTDYPRDIKAFYMKLNEDGRTVRAMDVLVPRLGEIIGGSEREADPGRLVQRMGELGMSIADYEWYLDLRRFGTVPHAGFGLGFERLVQYASGMQNIRDVIPFPRTPRNAAF